MKIILSPVFAFLVFLLLPGNAGAAQQQDTTTPITIRIMTVVICQQDGFLQNLLEPYLSGRNIRIEYSQGHHSEVARAVTEGRIDLAITHTKVQAMHKLEKNGYLEKGRKIFANAMAFLGPTGDPAGITGMHDPVLAVKKIQETGHCFVINGHDRLAKIQEKLLELAGISNSCVIRDEETENLSAVESAVENNAYTLWGLHPYARKGENKLQPVIIPHDMLLEDMSGWAVSGSPVKNEVIDLINYLKSSEAEKRIREFRLDKYKDLQAWWPAS